MTLPVYPPPRLASRLKENDPLFLQSIWSVAIRPAPDGQADDFYHHPIGSGPFVFKSREGNDEVILEANAHYYAGRPSLDRIVFSYQPDREKTWTRLLRGETDIASEIIPLNYKMTKQYQDRFYFDRYILPYHTIFFCTTPTIPCLPTQWFAGPWPMP